MTSRELYYSILKLAFSGKLLPQQDDESVDSFISLTNDTKRLLENSGEIKKQKKIIEPIEEPFDIPKNWVWMYMCDFCTDIFSGKSPKYEKAENEYRVIGQAANQDKGLDFSSLKYTNKEFWDSNERKMFLRQFDVLLNTLGNGTLGRSGIITDLPFPMLTDGHPFVFRTSNPWSSYYLFYYLQFKKSDIEKAANGTTNQTFLNLSSTKLWLIPAAPLEEQKRIVDKIEELLPLVGRYENAWGRLEKFNQEFPLEMEKSILETAIHGKLVSHSSGSAFNELQRIINKRELLVKSHVIKKDWPILDINDEVVPFEIPKNWAWFRIGQISSIISKGTTPRGGKLAYLNSGIGFLRAENVAGLDKLDKNNLKFIDEGTHYGYLARSVLRENDILITIAGTLGRTGLVRKEDIPLNINQAVSFVRLVDAETISLQYLIYALNAPSLQKVLAGQTKTTAIPNLTLEIIANCLVPLPPFDEQKRIVAKLEELLPLCRKLIK